MLHRTIQNKIPLHTRHYHNETHKEPVFPCFSAQLLLEWSIQCLLSFFTTHLPLSYSCSILKSQDSLTSYFPLLILYLHLCNIYCVRDYAEQQSLLSGIHQKYHNSSVKNEQDETKQIHCQVLARDPYSNSNLESSLLKPNQLRKSFTIKKKKGNFRSVTNGMLFPIQLYKMGYVNKHLIYSCMWLLLLYWVK